MRRQRSTKIVATVGPASSTREMLKKLFIAGVDVFRLNMSHGSHDEVRERHRLIREIELELNRPIGILVDLQGPKLRVGQFVDGAAELEQGQRFRFDGENLIRCEKGELSVSIGDKEYLVKEGDTLHYKTNLPHSWYNESSETVEFVITGSRPRVLRAALNDQLLNRHSE